MSVTVWPEAGDEITAAQWTAANKAMSIAPTYRVSGYTLSDGGGTTVSIAAGTAYVNGVTIVSDGAQSENLTDDDTNYVFLNPDGTHTVNTTGTNPGSNALLLGTVVVASGSVSSVSHEKNITNALNVYVRKPSDETVTNDATVNADSDLTFPVLNGELWEVELMLLLDQESTAAGFRMDFGVDGGSLDYVAWFIAPRRAGINIDSTFGFFTSEATITDFLSDDDIPLYVRALVTVTGSGDFQFKWAQETSDANDVTVAEGSVLIARRLLG